MEPRDQILAAHCGRCGSIWPRDQVTKPCGACGSPDLRPFLDYYAIFSLTPDRAGESELKSSYKKLSMKYHPDLNPQGKDSFLIVSEAFQVMKDAERRARYDHQYALAKNGHFSQARSPGFDPGRGGEEWVFTRRPPTQEEMEELFRQYQGMRRRNMNVVTASRVAGLCAAILAGVLGAFLGGIMAIPGAILGYGFGRMNPGLAPFLLTILSLLATVAVILGSVFAVLWLHNLWILAAILFAAYLFFGMTRRWARALGMG